MQQAQLVLLLVSFQALKRVRGLVAGKGTGARAWEHAKFQALKRIRGLVAGCDPLR